MKHIKTFFVGLFEFIAVWVALCCWFGPAILLSFPILWGRKIKSKFKLR